ncbi:hypothetical protein ASV26_11605 [Klebsiella aerogenes]|nr:hypothetical protein SS20_01945 [Klebsiella aerogenes]KLE45705.1 hypothetical protein YA13_13335 [Klebsiella aerogenes]KTH31957.1 hypothetical protein ASV26_11605 [Klebsiella aerogenes]
MPDKQCYHTHQHQTTQRAGQDELPANTLTATNKLVIMMIAISLGIDIPNQPHLFTGLPMRGEKTSAINILIEQGIATT